MNRAESRLAKKNGMSTKMIIDKKLSDSYKNGYDKGIDSTYKTLILVTAYFVRFYFGLGNKRFPEFVERYLNTIDAFRTGHLSPYDINRMKAECKKYGFDVDDE